MTASATGVRGVYVLGMHRSGTSVVTGVVDRLGLDGGPRRSMLSADEFNADGYWEQRPVIEWHDEVLAHLDGWASAPPPPLDEETRAAIIEQFRDGPDDLVRSLFSEPRAQPGTPRPWFLKDPRQCLLLWLWTSVRSDDFAVVVVRSPAGVATSLASRNRYPLELGFALWERYCHDLLTGLEGRPCVILRYEDLLADPTTWVQVIAEALDRNAPLDGERFVDRVDDAAALVRAEGRSVEPADRLQWEQSRLREIVTDLAGYHERLDLPDLPPLSAAGLRTIQRRRRWLNLARPLARTSRIKARVDRLPAVLRDLRGS